MRFLGLGLGDRAPDAKTIPDALLLRMRRRMNEVSRATVIAPALSPGFGLTERRRPSGRPLLPAMVLLVAAAAYLIGLESALLLAVLAGKIRWVRLGLADERRERLAAFRDNWSLRFHRDLFEPTRGPRRPPSFRP